MCVTKKGPSTFQLPDTFNLTSNDVNKGAGSAGQSASGFVDASTDQSRFHFSKQQPPRDGTRTSLRNADNFNKPAYTQLIIENAPAQLQDATFAPITVNQQQPFEAHTCSVPTIPDFPAPVASKLETLSISSNDFLIDSLNAATIPNKKQKGPKKRRRRHQKPGLTAKKQTRHFVTHNYHDHANEPPGTFMDPVSMQKGGDNLPKKKGGVAVPFPFKMHRVLDQIVSDGLAYVIGWQIHGRAFKIYDATTFVDNVMPKYFGQKKLTSFQRQLNLYGFQRLTRGRDDGAYYNELFLRGKEHLCHGMTRQRVKGTKYKAASNPDSEPDFYQMPFVAHDPSCHGVKMSANTNTTSARSRGDGGNLAAVTAAAPFLFPRTAMLMPGSTTTRTRTTGGELPSLPTALPMVASKPPVHISDHRVHANCNDLGGGGGGMNMQAAPTMIMTAPQGSQINMNMPMSMPMYTTNTPIYSLGDDTNKPVVRAPTNVSVPNFSNGGGGSIHTKTFRSNFFGLDPFVPNVMEPDLQNAAQYSESGYFNANNMMKQQAAVEFGNLQSDPVRVVSNKDAPALCCDDSIPDGSVAAVSTVGSSSQSGDDFLGVEMDDFVELYHPELFDMSDSTSSNCSQSSGDEGTYYGV
uniref:HSF-type DNA-binding domain-containing protein n=1 Tax=Leptocylindrus danicus TaxID=163516 RepID=A0A7S2LSQ7_9STRA|mmetsp:Transcript_8951/g.13294  ORF Transcript_8951/g.13294 Transcript_8951/m.13294 type:complete len:634 (+) Transcript_8951:78-1979(+)